MSLLLEVAHLPLTYDNQIMSFFVPTLGKMAQDPS